MRFLITFVMILSIIAFIHLSKTYPTNEVRTSPPNNVFVIDEDVSKVRNHQVCKNCKVCIAICPNNCITVN